MLEVIKMQFSENLKVLRKQKGYSQEQLAERLNVSRQAVSKWESEQGLPEMDKLLQLSELFQCSLDVLMKETIEETNLEFKNEYDHHHNKMSWYATLGIGFILTGVDLQLLLSIFFEDGTKSEFIPNSIFMMFVLVGVIFFIILGQKKEAFKKKYDIFPDDLYTQNEIDNFQQKFTKALASGVAIIILGVISQLLFEGMFNEDIANVVFMFFICIGVCIIVYFGTQKDKYEVKERNKENQNGIKNNELIGVVCGCIMIIATIIFFIWSFIFNSWEISWVVFPIFGMICGIATLLINLIKK